MINMQNHIIFFSGGLSSFSVADFVKENYPNDNIILYFTDTLWEDEDLYRFIFEVSDKLQLPLLIHSRGITPAQLMVKKRFIANNRAGICSKELKIKVAADYLKKGIVPEHEKWYNKQYLKDENFREKATLYFGIGIFEAHREQAIRKNWEDENFTVAMPLMEHDYNHEKTLKKYRIRIPDMYTKNFVHNNCKGRCVKAGQTHFKNLLMKDERTFIELMEQEIVISQYIRYTKQPTYQKDRDYLYNEVYEFVSTGKKSAKIQHLIDTHKYTKRWNFGKDSKGKDIHKPYTFMKSKSLEEIYHLPIQTDMFDYGGCGCFLDYQ